MHSDLSYEAKVWLQPQKRQNFLAAAMEGLGTDIRNKEFSL
jgi:hypothetical protein